MKGYRFSFARDAKLARRNELIISLSKSPLTTYTSIGKAFNLSPARVSQIVKQGSFQTEAI